VQVIQLVSVPDDAPVCGPEGCEPAADEVLAAETAEDDALPA